MFGKKNKPKPSQGIGAALGAMAMASSQPVQAATGTPTAQSPSSPSAGFPAQPASPATPKATETPASPAPARADTARSSAAASPRSGSAAAEPTTPVPATPTAGTPTAGTPTGATNAVYTTTPTAAGARAGRPEMARTSSGFSQSMVALLGGAFAKASKTGAYVAKATSNGIKSLGVQLGLKYSSAGFRVAFGLGAGQPLLSRFTCTYLNKGGASSSAQVYLTPLLVCVYMVVKTAEVKLVIPMSGIVTVEEGTASKTTDAATFVPCDNANIVCNSLRITCMDEAQTHCFLNIDMFLPCANLLNVRWVANAPQYATAIPSRASDTFYLMYGVPTTTLLLRTASCRVLPNSVVAAAGTNKSSEFHVSTGHVCFTVGERIYTIPLTSITRLQRVVQEPKSKTNAPIFVDSDGSLDDQSRECALRIITAEGNVYTLYQFDSYHQVCNLLTLLWSEKLEVGAAVDAEISLRPTRTRRSTVTSRRSMMIEAPALIEAANEGARPDTHPDAAGEAYDSGTMRVDEGTMHFDSGTMRVDDGADTPYFMQKLRKEGMAGVGEPQDGGDGDDMVVRSNTGAGAAAGDAKPLFLQRLGQGPPPTLAATKQPKEQGMTVIELRDMLSNLELMEETDLHRTKFKFDNLEKAIMEQLEAREGIGH